MSKFRRVKQALAVAAVVLIAGCGGSSSRSFANPMEIATALGCQQSYDPESGAVAPADVATCRFNGQQVTLVAGTNAERDATVEMAKSIAGKFGVKTAGATVEGDGWAAMADTARVAKAVQQKLGGKIL